LSGKDGKVRSVEKYTSTPPYCQGEKARDGIGKPEQAFPVYGYKERGIFMTDVERQLGERFIRAKCKEHGGTVQRLAMSGTGISRLLEIQAYRYAFVYCGHCGTTEVFNRAARSPFF
jgi:uncharacterized protein